MERKPFINERHPFIWSELFIGDWDLFKKVLQNPETVFVYDIDLVLANSAKVVFKNFTDKYGIKTELLGAGYWDYLTDLAIKNGLSAEDVEHAEDDWYKPEVLKAAPRYLYTRPLVHRTLKTYGPENNYVLTSRAFYLRESTFDWFGRQFPDMLPKNILIRENGNIRGEEYKVKCITELSRKAPWTVFIDDNATFIKAILDADIENCLVIYVPLEKEMPNLRHESLIVIKRFPEEIQGMYPLMYAVDKAIGF